MKGRPEQPAFYVDRFSKRTIFKTKMFIGHSQNKTRWNHGYRGTSHSSFRCRRGQCKHVRRYSMTNRFLISAAAIALIAGAGFANAQGTGMGRESGGAAAQQSAPSGNSAAPSNRQATEPSGSSSGMKGAQSESGMKGAQSEQKSSTVGQSQRGEENAPGQKSKGMSSENETKGGKDTKATQSQEKSSTVGQSQRGEENAPGQKSKGMNSENETKGGKDMKAEGREGRDRDQNAQTRDRNGNMNAETKSQTTTTTGQAGAAGKLSTEQRTKITTVIRNEHVAPVNNVDFDISVGTRVPRERVSLRPLPSEVVTVYPEWRGYQFILVRDQILVVDPATYEIVAVLPA
jgi:uncharacterized protein DUF1236